MDLHADPPIHGEGQGGGNGQSRHLFPDRSRLSPLYGLSRDFWSGPGRPPKRERLSVQHLVMMNRFRSLAEEGRHMLAR
jgi:hypothetical protein